MKVAVSDIVDSSRNDIQLSSGDADSIRASPSAVSDISDSVDETEGTQEPPTSLCTPTSIISVVSPLQADLQDSSAAADSNISDASSVDRLSEDGFAGEVGADDQNVKADGDETEGKKLSVNATANFQCHGEASSCKELSSSLTDSLDICEQGVIGTYDDGLIAESEVGAVTVSVTNECSSISCHCGSSTSSDVVYDDRSVESPEFEDENVAGSQCSCDVESERSLAELETVRPLSESAQPLNSDGEQDLTVTDANESSRSPSGDDADVIPISSLDVHDLHTSASSLPPSDISQITPPSMEMETESEAVVSSFLPPDVTATSLVPESDGEPGGKASKLDRLLIADCVTGSDSEATDTGVLHMSVGFQSAADDDKTAAFGGGSDISNDSPIGVLMVCDDDGLVSSIGAAPSAVLAESNEISLVASSSSSEDHELLSADTPLSSIQQPSDGAATEEQPSGICVDENLSDSSDAVTIDNVMLYEVDSRSCEMNELLANNSQNDVNTSHGAQSADTSILSREDGEYRRVNIRHLYSAIYRWNYWHAISYYQKCLKSCFGTFLPL